MSFRMSLPAYRFLVTLDASADARFEAFTLILAMRSFFSKLGDLMLTSVVTELDVIDMVSLSFLCC